MKKDFLLLIALLLIGASAFFAISIRTNAVKNEYAVVSVDGIEYGRYALSENQTVDIDNGNGGYNRLVIQDGVAFVDDASCPDHICVKTGKASESLSIVCLPNRVMIYLEGGESV